jgi:dTDP-4-dehydrorhamnose reductase
MIDQPTVLVTGGTGLLGTQLRNLLPNAAFPSHHDFDVTDYRQMALYVRDRMLRTVVHAAAFTSPPKIDENPERAVSANIVGTANVVKLCMERGYRLIYISTDYVFDGERGNYTESDAVLPVNKYAWSKLGGECAVRLLDGALIVRTSFGPNEFPYEKAFVDQWTSRIAVREFAERLVKLIDSDVTGVIHVGAPRRTVVDYARATSPAKPIGELSSDEVSFVVPRDTSLDTTRFDRIFTR